MGNRHCQKNKDDALQSRTVDQLTSSSSSLLASDTGPLRSSPTSSLEPAAPKFYHRRDGIPLEVADNPNIEVVKNIYAGELAIGGEKQRKPIGQFFPVFNNFHDASVKITVNLTDGITVNRTEGSGILFKPDEDQLVIVTVAHIFEDLRENKKGIETEICLETSYTDNGKSEKYTIPLEMSDIEITINYQKDVAVITLDERSESEVRKHVRSFPSASILDGSDESFMMIHFANENRKQVTTGRRQQCSHAALKENFHMDGGPGASGAPIYSLSGNVVAIHKCRNQEIKSCVLIKDVIDAEMYENRYSYIYEVLTEKEKYKYNPGSIQESATDNPFEVNEGKKSQQLLLDKIGEDQLPREHLTTAKLPKISDKATLKYITTNYPLKLQQTLLECLGKGGKHETTKEYSFQNEIESDHFPPYDAYRKALKRCNNMQLKERIEKASESRDNLPAITIPYKVHKKLDTTGSSCLSQKFRKDQAKFMRKDKFFKAIEMNFKSYNECGLFDYSNLNSEQSRESLKNQYLQGFSDGLHEHVKFEFINEEEKQKLLKILFPDNLETQV